MFFAVMFLVAFGFTCALALGLLLLLRRFRFKPRPDSLLPYGAEGILRAAADRRRRRTNRYRPLA
ncbi:MAG: hypothetical protein M3198_05210, partial [Actinomycetota bacterium]|nr:hypothetical protein [Actinomycetota bacterium]